MLNVTRLFRSTDDIQKLDFHYSRTKDTGFTMHILGHYLEYLAIMTPMSTS